jgi:hypothetical protein
MLRKSQTMIKAYVNSQNIGQILVYPSVHSLNFSTINETNTWIFVLPSLGRYDNDDFKDD